MKNLKERVAPFLVAYFWLFGLFASYSFDRLGLAIVVPPVAWFDSVYYWWAPPGWQRQWDSKAYELGVFVLADEDQLAVLEGTNPDIRRARKDVDKWLSEVPSSERERLRDDLVLLSECLWGACTSVVDNMVKGHGIHKPPVDERLAGKPIMIKLWNFLLDDMQRNLGAKGVGSPRRLNSQDMAAVQQVMKSVVASGRERSRENIHRMFGK